MNLTKTAATFWASLIAQAWEDEEFKQKLMSNPKQVLMDQGFMKFLDGEGDEVNIKVEEATTGESCSYDEGTKTFTFYLPKSPESLGQLAFEGKFMPGLIC